jgi:hypothetical protein
MIDRVFRRMNARISASEVDQEKALNERNDGAGVGICDLRGHVKRFQVVSRILVHIDTQPPGIHHQDS